MQKQTKIYLISFVLILVIASTSIVVLTRILNNQNYKNTPSNYQTSMKQITSNAEKFNLQFNGTRSFTYLKDQVDIGFRPPNSTGIVKERTLIVQQLHKFNWTVIFNNFTYRGVPSANILAFPQHSQRKNVTLFGAHYDTRWYADAPNSINKTAPVLGANDGASGVAVLMEFAQTFANRSDVGLLFIDAEDQGNINGWIYGAGAYEFTNSTVLNQYFPDGKSDIRVFVLLDMIGDWHLNIKKEGYSNSTINDQIWASADSLGYSSSFVNTPGYFMDDDHLAFLSVGIPAVDIIDFDYTDQNGANLHHTTFDNLNFVSATSLWIVGQTMEHWLQRTTNNILT